MNIIFFGNTTFSLIGAKILHEKIGITTIVTIPDRQDKRGNAVQSPLKTFAIEKNIPCIPVDRLNDETIQQLTDLQPDFLIVEDYGLILPKKLLAIPKYAPLNIHHSLLPKYRGPAPAPFAILAGEKVSGVSIIHMNDKVDSGAIYAQKEYTLRPDETTVSLLTKMNTYGGTMLIDVINDIVAGSAHPQLQDESKVIPTFYMKKSDGYIATENIPDKTTIDRMIRAYFPWPNVWTKVQIKNKEVRIKFLPNELIQMEGKKAISKKDFLNGYPELTELINHIL